MKRADKINRRKLRAFNRRKKKLDELKQIIDRADMLGISFDIARDVVRRENRGCQWQCDCDFSDCNSRGYCNGDC